jgi:hypothetical protein
LRASGITGVGHHRRCSRFPSHDDMMIFVDWVNMAVFQKHASNFSF